MTIVSRAESSLHVIIRSIVVIVHGLGYLAASEADEIAMRAGFDKMMWLGVMLLLGAGGCSALSPPEQGPVSTPARPLWSESEVRQHLRFFNGSDVAERGTGTAGYATAAAYVAARMQEFELQPALEGIFRLVYSTPINALRSARLVPVGGDSLAFYPGVDFLPDGRSDAGTMTFTMLSVLGQELTFPGAGQHPAIVVAAAEVTTERLQDWRRVGVQVVLMVGPLEPRPAARPVPGVLIMQVTQQAMAHLLQTSPGAVERLLQSGEEARQPLPQPVRVQVEGEPMPSAGAINTIGYLAGKQPALSQEAVLVCADLDDIGTFAGVRTMQADHLGASTAALLEVARQYAFFTNYYSLPERSVVFAVLSGSRLEQAGLRAYLQQPTWAPSRIHAVIYVGLDPVEEPAVRALLAPREIPLYTVPPPADTTQSRVVALLPGRRSARGSTVQSRTEQGRDNPGRQPPPRLPELIEAAVQDALLMAESVNNLLLREAITPASFRPIAADTLRVPVENE